MRCSVAVLAVLLLVSAGLLGAEAGDCLRVWVDARGQAAECKAVDVQAELSHSPRVCPAASAAKAVVKIRLTSCREQVAAAVAPPGSAVAGREFVVRAQASEGEVVKELAGLNGDSWAGAARDLCRAIAVWHENVGKSH
jgi:hypothetical protein